MPPSELLAQAVQSGRRRGRWKAWRAVEAQNVVSTLRLSDNDPARQDLLERILEESKPPVPPAAVGLHYLLATPFRYPPGRHGSRFRAWPEPGVLYGASERPTACAEMGYWRWRFARDSAGLEEIPAAAQTLFRFGVGGVGIDLAAAPLDQWRPDWIAPDVYAATQALGRVAREAGVQFICYQSVRDPEAGRCFAVLDAGALRPGQPLERETWYLTVTRQRAVWTRERERFVFEF